jgi:hypothetical protein
MIRFDHIFTNGLDYDNRTLANGKVYLDLFKEKMKEFSNKFKRIYLNLYNFDTDFDEAMVGRVGYRIKSRIEPMWMQKAIVIANELDNMDFGDKETEEKTYAYLVYIK